MRKRLFKLMILGLVAGMAGAQTYRGLYVNDLAKLLSDQNERAMFMDWITQEGVNALSLYDLNRVLPDTVSHRLLADFIMESRARGVDRVIGVVGGAWTAEHLVMRYQQAVEALNLELEWWVGRDHFDQYVIEMDGLTDTGMPLEAYIGWLSKGRKKRLAQAQFLMERSSLVSVHVYQKHPTATYVKDRLKVLNTATGRMGKVMDIVIIFSMEDDYSGKLSRNQNYPTIYQELLSEVDPGQYDNLQFIGWKIFCYTDAIRHRPLKNGN